MNKIIVFIFLMFCVAGCATVQQKEPFDTTHFDSMNNVAVLVRDLKINGKTSLLPFAKSKQFQTPVVYDSEIKDTSAGNVPVSGGWSVGISVSIPSPINQGKTDRLQSFLKDYDIRYPLMSKFKEEFKKIKNVDIPDYEEIEKLCKIHYALVLDKLSFTTKDDFSSEFDSFRTDLIKSLNSDTLILIDIGEWGFCHKTFLDFPTTIGNFMMKASFKIIRLSDAKNLFERNILVDFSKSSFKKKNRNLELFLKGDKPIIFQTLDELIQEAVAEIIRPLK